MNERPSGKLLHLSGDQPAGLTRAPRSAAAADASARDRAIAIRAVMAVLPVVYDLSSRTISVGPGRGADDCGSGRVMRVVAARGAPRGTTT